MAFVWEQRKVSEIADRFDNLRVPVAANLRTPGTTPYYGANGIQDYVEGYTHDGEFVLVAEDGANDLKNYPVKCVNGRIWVNNHAHVLQARPQIASNQFLAYSMSQANIEALLVGGGRAKLNAEVMMGIVLRIPRLQEQEVIGGYFYKLDQLITLHQRKRMLRRCFFSIDWEQRKLGEVAKYRNGKAHENCIDDDGKYIVVNSKFVSTNGKVKKFSNMQNEPLFENEVAFVLSDVPNGRAIARTFLVEKSDKYTLNQRIAGITPLNETDPYYLHVLMNRHPYFLAFDDGVKQTNLSVSDVMKFESYYPKYEEQETIGRCFSQLDQLITLHQCKSNFCKKNEVNAWEQRKFVEFVKNAAKKNKDNIDLEPYAVTNDRGFIAQKDAHDDFGYMSNVDRTAYNIVPPNSFAYNPARINVGSLGYYEGTENVIVSSLYEVFQTEEYIDDKFLLHWFKSDSFPRWIEKLQEGSVRLYFYFDKLVQCQMMVPSLEEQKRISAYLDSIDQLITLHQRKCDEIKKLKKYMLQNMFPQDEEKVPKIRFYGFTDDWEQRKLGDLVERITKKNQDLLSELPLTISAQYGLIDQKEFFDKRVASKDISGYYLIKNGEFAYNKSTSTDAPWGAIKRLDRYETGVLSTLYIVFGIKKDTELNSNFLTAYYSTNLWHKEIHEIAAEGARNHGLLNISPADFFKTKLSTPQDLKEQNKIGNYFIQLDQLITLHQWECNINENTEGNDEKQRKPIKKLIISEGNLSLVDDMFLLHRMTFLVCNKYILLRLNVVKYKITIIIISNILYSIVSLLIIACYLIVINKQLIILIYVEISVVIIKGDDDYARIRS